MDKIWFMLVEGNEEGPYSLANLKNHPLFTPDTLVRKKDSKKWLPARDVYELQKAFEDEQPMETDLKKNFPPLPPSDELVIEAREDPPQFYLWLILTLSLLAYILFRFFSVD